MSYADFLADIVHSSSGRVILSRAGMATLARLSVDLLRQGRGVGWIVPDREGLQSALALMTLFSPELSTEEKTEGKDSMPWVSLPPFSVRLGGRDGWVERLSALYALRSGRAKCVVLTPDNLLSKWIPADFFEGQELCLERGEEISPDMILEQAVAWGYERVPMVANPGEVARRGDILDIMPPGYSKPLRFDFFGDLVEEIRLFDPSSQRSREELTQARLLPVHPIRQDAASREKAVRRWKRLRQKDLLTENEHFALNRLLEQGDFRLLPGSCYDASTCLEEWLPKDTIWLLPGRHDLYGMLSEAEQHWHTILEEQDAAGRPQPARLALRPVEHVERMWEKAAVVHAEPLVMGIEKQGVDLAERRIDRFADLFPSPAEADRPWQTLVQAIRKWQGGKRQILLCFTTDRSRNKFLKLAEQDGLFPSLRYSREDPGLYALIAPFRSGVDIIWDESLVLGEDVLQPHGEKGRRVPTGVFKGLDRHETLVPGDLLVHRDYGIARFGGLFRMELGGSANDFLLLHYADDDKLYLPVDRLSLIQRFKGGSESMPVLDRLGGGGWQAGREKIRRAVEKIAQDLVEMYAWRKVAKGFQYPPLGDLYRDFEASFGFEETPDQARAIQDVLEDMEKPEPMDRLICGDVGFGKTEVALRAAFRAASEGRQVALLCPTTVLAEQHYQTFRSRLSGFAVNVGLLSRFVSPQKQKEVLKAAALGQIDVLVGTHRLLSGDVDLPNLALLILDEEQRFGVRHKEKLKQLRKNVDVLTLTATPIPRTLQLSMSGVRELSVIDTAPLDRKPVSTAILQRDRTTLKEILERELEREGQVFWVYNRVQGLERVVDFVRELVPQARIAMAHGQLSEKALEETMHAFWHGEIDILVCTAIVESGLDFPRANTLIVDQAQMFGLGQLYQLRGRVGRSDRQAFAGFVIPDFDSLSETAKERLRIILDLDYLGAGFQIAMEDLRLRGAGNILGEVQSGHMNRVGLDLYLEMLEQAVNKLKGEGTPVYTETEINLALTAHIPETYIPDGRERLRWYKMLSSTRDAQARQELVLELRDRFGHLPDELETFLAVLALKQFLSEAQAVRADIHPDRVRIVWDQRQTAIAAEKIPAFLAGQKGRVRLLPPATLDYRLDIALPVAFRLDEVRHALQELLAKPVTEAGVFA